MNFETLQNIVNKKIEDSFITKDLTGKLYLKIYNSIIEYSNPYYLVKDSNQLIIAKDILSYDIAVLIAEQPKFAPFAIELDNSFSIYYNDILHQRRAYKTADIDKKEVLNARFEESKIKLLSVLKAAKRTQWIMKNHDKYTK